MQGEIAHICYTELLCLINRNGQKNCLASSSRLRGHCTEKSDSCEAEEGEEHLKEERLP